MKVVFLDFDGVITIQATRWNISLPHIKRVKQICDTTGAKLVISSSWQRYENGEHKTPEERVAYWLEGVLMKRVKGDLRDFFEKYTYDMTGRFYGEYGNVRGSDIKSWLVRHPEVDSYVILDDESDMLDEQLWNFVQTDMGFGIQDREVSLCIDILNGVKPINTLNLNDEIKFRWWVKLKKYADSNYDEIYEKYFPWKEN